jgi:acyl-CoA oxidase
VTITYDDNKQELILSSPPTLSQKYWITNCAVHANYVPVLGQTIVKDKMRVSMPLLKLVI